MGYGYTGVCVGGSLDGQARMSNSRSLVVIAANDQGRLFPETYFLRSLKINGYGTPVWVVQGMSDHKALERIINRYLAPPEAGRNPTEGFIITEAE